MSRSVETPFDSIENAQDYIRLLADAVAEAKEDVQQDIAAAEQSKLERRLQALQLVNFKLEKLETTLKSSSRTLNDLRTLRRLLLEERGEEALVATTQEKSRRESRSLREFDAFE